MYTIIFDRLTYQDPLPPCPEEGDDEGLPASWMEALTTVGKAGASSVYETAEEALTVMDEEVARRTSDGRSGGWDPDDVEWSHREDAAEGYTSVRIGRAEDGDVIRLLLVKLDKPSFIHTWDNPYGSFGWEKPHGGLSLVE